MQTKKFKAWWDAHEFKKLEKRRKEVLSAIRSERLNFQAMVQRAQYAGEIPDIAFLTTVRERLAEIEDKANQEGNIDELRLLVEDAERQGQLRAYVCPSREITSEGHLVIDLMEGWKVPEAVVSTLRSSICQKLDQDTDTARSALRALFQERDSWESRTNEYEMTMARYVGWLFGATIVLFLLAILAFHFPPPFFLAGLLCAGAGGSSVSVMGKMPGLEVGLSTERAPYRRRILARIGIGIAASLFGCAFLGWGLLPVSIQSQTFADAFNACATSPPMDCTGLKTLILLAVPGLLGLSERALSSFEKRTDVGAGFSRSREAKRPS
jgi:hypothetical protein